MAYISCPSCGKSNPDLLDVCQFCQAPLKPDSTLRIGEMSARKDTGEPDPGLPDWLKDIQQQAKDAAEEEAAEAATHPRIQKEEPPDLLAGLASQASHADEDDIPDWLASISPSVKSEPSTPSAPSSAEESDSDFFAQFNQAERKPESARETPPAEETPAWMRGAGEESAAPPERDELSEWFTRTPEGTEETVEPDQEQTDLGWGGNLGEFSAGAEQPLPREEEDLSWLHNLEAAARQTGELPTQKHEPDWMADFEKTSAPSQPSASQDDLSWLDRLGGVEEPSRPAPEEQAAPQEDLSWLNHLGASSESRPFDAAPNQPDSPQAFTAGAEQEPDWLNNLGGIPESEQPVQPFHVPEEEKTSEDLNWLNDLGKPAPAQEPSSAQEDLSWLNELGGAPEPLSTPPFATSDSEKVSPKHTAPLDQSAVEGTEPDWLKSATEAPSMPAPGDLSMDWFAGQVEQEKAPPPEPQVTPLGSDIFSAPNESATLSNQDVDSLFSVEMPDWLSRSEPEAAEPASQQAGSIAADRDESLAPVDLPSWVQAMRPVEAVISEAGPRVEDQPAETEGPLAGLHGVIPIVPVGSPRRPKAVSLTLQTTPEQQSSALLLEQILGTETSPRALVTSTVVTTQHWLRWALAALFLIGLSVMIFLRTQIMPVPASLPVDAGDLSNAVMGIPANAKILVVIDYEPSLAGEMEAVGGPLLDQIVLLSQPNLSFVATSPNGAVLVERLLVNTKINPSGVINLGYLPGGSAGVLGFLEAPSQIIPSAGVQFFAEYAALVVLTDHAESGRVWVEQLQNRKQVDLTLMNQPLLVIASAQAGPLLQPYVSSRQITGMISGLSDAARYEAWNNNRPGMARAYWDTFGIGLMMAVTLIVIGSVWSLLTGMRARRANAEQG